MVFTIAVAGKGGSGKTSVTSLVIRHLGNKHSGSVLAIDADPNANLGESLGLTVERTVGTMLASFNTDKLHIPAGMTKEAWLEFKLNELMVESKGFDLLSMGRGEGDGCYCYPNSVLRKYIDIMEDNYAYVVMDNEAGMEHLSRKTTQNVDELLLVSNHSVKGVRTLARIIELVAELKLSVKRQAVIISMAPEGKLDPLVVEELKRLKIEPFAVVPYDGAIVEYDLSARPLLELPDSSKAVMAVDEFMDRVLMESKAVKSA
ncbi:MAG: AAA family ATPase [Chloroflexi bacterium]|nr:AAA family ATPase [Chloroflexota bacterium]